MHNFFRRYLYYIITLNIATCFSSQGTICANFQIKYIGFFQDTVYQDPAHLCTTVQRNDYILTFDSLTTHQLCAKLADLVVCVITMVCFPDGGHLQTKMCRTIQCDIII